ncbi:cyclic nucleotide-binding domain-containing protein [Emticicia sp. CRIBPO]|uniref:Crp/Fnr family transcriptional regulator n=1 Tax=Emticicia sp. CRIBPO TaxID=2683258 RepID=UPI00141209B4|nr:Crp/Fnr family transcriptional regulator [Emticicia sp. CRIBPO]NBA86725.1 cyclic nucleotide-binding domain-containing protein [Emticicia sp. CRIBPO]
MNTFRDFLEQKIKLTENEWTFFTSGLVRQEFPSKKIILKKGETEKYISFIEKGSVRFFVPNDESELTFAFIFENDLVCAYDSFLTQTPCQYAAETLTPTVIWRFSYDTLQKLYSELPVSNIIGRIASEEIYLKKAKRELSFLLDSAEERYLRIFTERPNLLKEIPLKYIASYIGISPQALSRIRKRIT